MNNLTMSEFLYLKDKLEGNIYDLLARFQAQTGYLPTSVDVNIDNILCMGGKKDKILLSVDTKFQI